MNALILFIGDFYFILFDRAHHKPFYCKVGASRLQIDQSLGYRWLDCQAAFPAENIQAS